MRLTFVGASGTVTGSQYLAQVGQQQASSSHRDANELLVWMGKLPNRPKAVFVTHGEPAASDPLRARIEHELGWPALVPESRSVHELFNGLS